MSAVPQPRDRASAADIVAGYLATLAIFVSGLAIVYRPVRLAPAAAVVAIVAAALAGPNSSRLAGFAIAAAAVGWIVGMTVAIVTNNPLW